MMKDSDVSHALFLQVKYTEGAQELYLLPVSFALTRKTGQLDEFVVEGLRVRLDYDWLTIKAKLVMEDFPQSVIARLYVGEDEGILYDAAYDSKLHETLLTTIIRRKKIRGDQGDLFGFQGKKFRRLLEDKELPLSSQVLKAEQSNTSILYGDKYYFKLFRSLKEGVNPDQEIIRFLTEKTNFSNIPPFAGSIQYRHPGLEPIAIGLLQGFIPNQGDAWTYTKDAMGRYFEKVLSRVKEIQDIPKAPVSLFDIDLSSIPQLLRELIEGHYLEMVTLLGKRTGEMHLALSSAPDEPDFAPEPFSMLYQRSVYQSMRGLVRRVLQSLRKKIKSLPEPLQEQASWMLGSEEKILSRLQEIVGRRFSAMKIRIHGDYHLGQVLYTGKDFVIIDFEGEPARELTERRLKRSPLRDIAGMVRSFHYAAYMALLKEASLRSEDIPVLEPWTDLWYRYVSGVFIRSYLETVGNAPFIPAEKKELEIILNAFLLEKAVYELGYELNNRPEWVIIPFRGLKDLLQGES
jgi:maltose alpha-D-glucosyltransferase/alpha-amylase